MSRCLQWRVGWRWLVLAFLFPVNRTEGSVLPVQVQVRHTAVDAGSSVIPVMVLQDGSSLRPFQ